MIGVLVFLAIIVMVVAILLMVCFELPRFKHGPCCLHDHRIKECKFLYSEVPKEPRLQQRAWFKRIGMKR